MQTFTGQFYVNEKKVFLRDSNFIPRTVYLKREMCTLISLVMNYQTNNKIENKKKIKLEKEEKKSDLFRDFSRRLISAGGWGDCDTVISFFNPWRSCVFTNY